MNLLFASNCLLFCLYIYPFCVLGTSIVAPGLVGSLIKYIRVLIQSALAFAHVHTVLWCSLLVFASTLSDGAEWRPATAAKLLFQGCVSPWSWGAHCRPHRSSREGDARPGWSVQGEEKAAQVSQKTGDGVGRCFFTVEGFTGVRDVCLMVCGLVFYMQGIQWSCTEWLWELQSVEHCRF